MLVYLLDYANIPEPHVFPSSFRLRGFMDSGAVQTVSLLASMDVSPGKAATAPTAVTAITMESAQSLGSDAGVDAELPLIITVTTM